MGDLISRQDAIDAADRADYTGLSVEDVKKVTDEVVKGLKRLSTVTPKPHWISTSERLPEEREMVLICKPQKDHPFVWTKEPEQIDIAWREPEARTGIVKWMTRHFEFIPDEKVIAWCELPEPYKTEK